MTVDYNESVLNSIKLQCGIPPSHTEFDDILIIDINTVFSVLHQLGVGPSTPFYISDEEDTWSEFICQENMEMVKSYVGLRVRQLFDPPTGVAADAMQHVIDELTFRLNVGVNEDEEM